MYIESSVCCEVLDILTQELAGLVKDGAPSTAGLVTDGALSTAGLVNDGAPSTAVRTVACLLSSSPTT
jgi:hypothetical protein